LFYETFGLRSKIAGVTCIFMNERYGALAHPAWLRMLAQPAATRPSPQITLGRLVIIVNMRTNLEKI